jgi:glycosyltransferase involved in cell wall biosynthesis
MREVNTNDPLIEIVIPVYNEEAQLAASVTTLHAYLRHSFPYRFRITIADNASTDSTPCIAEELAARDPHVTALRLERKGRGLALRTAWGRSTADVVSYMDVDLSTHLGAFLPLIMPLVAGRADLAIGSRLARGAVVTRSPRREVISRAYNALIKTTFFNRFSDAQCGFKAGRTALVQQLLPLIENNHWFFDTEMLLLAEHNGLRIAEVPVCWVEDPDTRVRLGSTIKEDLHGLWRMRRTFWRGAGRLATRRPAAWLDDHGPLARRPTGVPRAPHS